MNSFGPHAELARAESVRRIEHLAGEPGRRARRSLTAWLSPPPDSQIPPLPEEVVRAPEEVESEPEGGGA
jgi:hypothetical protein